MLEGLIVFIFIVLSVFTFLGFCIFSDYIEKEQDHRHKIELEKAKQGIFDQSPSKEPFFKKYCKQIIFAIILVVIIIGICYVFKVPSDLPKYILDIIK